MSIFISEYEQCNPFKNFKIISASFFYISKYSANYELRNFHVMDKLASLTIISVIKIEKLILWVIKTFKQSRFPEQQY